MSLDVYLKADVSKPRTGSGIYIRWDGMTREVSRAVWDELNPGVDPIICPNDGENNEVYSSNITHNLTRMASEAGIYACLWRPDENGITKASQLIEPLSNGYQKLRDDPVKFKQFNPSNGWGNYENFIEFVRRYLNACISNPEADVSVSR